MRYFLLTIAVFCAGYSLSGAETPLQFKPIFPADIPYSSDAAHSESVVQLMNQREALLKELYDVRTKILKEDPVCQALHQDVLAAEKNLNGHLRSRRSIVDLEQNLARVEMQIRRLAPAETKSLSAADSIVFVSQGKTNLDPNLYAEPQKAADLFREREIFLTRLMVERKKLLVTDKKAISLGAEVIERNKKLAVQLESKKDFRAVLDQLEAVNGRLSLELKKEEPVAKPVNTQASK